MADNVAEIAVVDDEPAVRRALKRLLRSAGFEVRTYSGGADFLQAAQTRQPHCVVIDIQMRPMDGFAVLQRLKALGVSAPAILTTAYELANDDYRLKLGGAIGFLRKPFNDEVLIEMVRVALRMTRVESSAEPGTPTPGS